MKRIIALILVLSLSLCSLPAAFGANIGKTTEGLKRAKGVYHVGEDIRYYKQALVETLDDYMAEFKSERYYYAGVWNEAKKLYEDEVARIRSLSELEELISESFFGTMPNDTTLEVCTKLETLSSLTKSYVTKASDLQKLKTNLKNQISETLKYNYKKANFNDFYWDRVMTSKQEAFEDIESAKSFADYAFVQQQWEYTFDFYELDPGESDSSEYLDKYLLTKTEMEDLKYLLIGELYAQLEELKTRGYSEKKVYSDKVYKFIDKLDAQLDKAEYAEQSFEIYEDYASRILALIGVKPEEPKTAATISFKQRTFGKLDSFFFDTYNRDNYSQSGWEELLSILDNAQVQIMNAEYREDIGSAFSDNIKKDWSKVKTLAEELKQAKKDCIATLKDYIGSKRYNQSKVKKLVAEGTKKINAAKDTQSCYTICERYTKALEKTAFTFKIAVKKSGKGSVSKSKTLTYGESYTVKIVPAAGYKIKSITVDGKKVKLTNAYRFKSVTKAHSIKVTFGK